MSDTRDRADPLAPHLAMVPRDLAYPDQFVDLVVHVGVERSGAHSWDGPLCGAVGCRTLRFQVWQRLVSNRWRVSSIAPASGPGGLHEQRGHGHSTFSRTNTAPIPIIATPDTRATIRAADGRARNTRRAPRPTAA